MAMSMLPPNQSRKPLLAHNKHLILNQLRQLHPLQVPHQAKQVFNKIEALERNVTLITGFLEELSVKYIKQIDEINNAVKMANDPIIGAVDREELAKENFYVLERKIKHLD